MSLLHNSKHKLKHVYRTIERLRSSDFPIKAGVAALSRLHEAFAKLDKSLDRAVRANDERAIEQVAKNINLKVYQALPILGFILRSTNVRNAFELLEPLQTIAEQTMQGKPSLILSSEWDYVPFAYPQSLEDLKSLVLIGLPATEAASALLVPIAGHELGHAAWRNRGIEGSVVNTLQMHCGTLYDENRVRFRKIFKEYKEDDFVARDVLTDAIAESVNYAARQAEELFCDLFAYSIFGASYIHSFAYLLSPGTGEVDPNYPSIETRISTVREIAKFEGISVPSFKDLGFVAEARRGDDRHKFILEMAEPAVAKIIPGLWRSVLKIVAGTVRPNETLAIRHLNELKVGTPAPDPACLGDIINAGWMLHGEIVRAATSSDAASKRLDHLNEMLLKTIEVMEFNRRTSP